MKKIILGLVSILTVLTFAGCATEQKENVKLDLTKISSQLDTLTTDEISIQSVIYEDMGVFGELTYVYDFDFQEKLGLNSELVTEYVVNYNEETKELLAMFKPAEGKTDEVKSQLNTFMTSVNAQLEEVNGLLIYVNSSNNTKVIETVKNTKAPVFGMMMEVTKDQTKDVLSIESADVEEFLMKMPMMMVQSNTYIIAKPVEGKEDSIKSALDEYMTALENQWATYLPDQYELVKNRKVEKIGDYLVYIISSDNELVFNTIKNNKIVAE